MCTISWRHTPEGYQLFVNRDESRTRHIAFPPQLELRDGTRFIAPRDADRGGTWIALNEFGIGICLLNGANLSATAPPALPGLRSRGCLVLALAALRNTKQMLAHLEYTPLEEYSAFTIAILAPQKPAHLMEWNGGEKHFAREPAPFRMLASSSFDSAGARRYRESLFNAHLRHGGSHEDFHASHGDGPSAYSPCMHRPDAETVSFSRLDVTACTARLTYSPGAPCLRLPAHTLEMPLAG